MSKRSILVAVLLSATVGTAFADAHDFIQQNRTPFAGQLSREQVKQELAAVKTTVNGEAYGHDGRFVAQRTRAEVQAEAVAAAQAPNQNIDVSAYVNSQLPVGLNGEAATRQAAADSRAPL